MNSCQCRFVRGILLGLAGAAVVGVVAGLYGHLPEYFGRITGCPFHDLTGWHCPGCGTTRAVHAAMNGEFRQAFAYNQIAIVVVPLVGLALVNSLWSWACNRPVQNHGQRRKWCGSLIIIGMVVYAVLRNVPHYPFTLLAPHELMNGP